VARFTTRSGVVTGPAPRAAPLAPLTPRAASVVSPRAAPVVSPRAAPVAPNQPPTTNHQGFLVRRAAKARIAACLTEAVHAAAIEIQRHCRATVARSETGARKAQLYDNFALIIQACRW